MKGEYLTSLYNLFWSSPPTVYKLQGTFCEDGRSFRVGFSIALGSFEVVLLAVDDSWMCPFVAYPNGGILTFHLLSVFLVYRVFGNWCLNIFGFWCSGCSETDAWIIFIGREFLNVGLRSTIKSQCELKDVLPKSDWFWKVVLRKSRKTVWNEPV